ncbi:hypothetical protein [Sulfitobacter sp. 1A12056]|uniref:RipA family octameric membrane protein n=1 Tax=Sulfitobacter sp. 1A12056 TaxID=3368592 RepID=UPI003746C62A
MCCDNEELKALREEYLTAAGLAGPDRSCARRQALDRAWSVRNFEIDLYWKRSLYFWGFQVAFLAGAGVAIGMLNEADRQIEPFLLTFGILLSLLGCLSATLWVALERGSKDWQDNWERHIDLLEEEFTGAIYKTYVVPIERNGRSFSVSKLNSWMTLATAGFWSAALVILLFGLVARFGYSAPHYGFGVAVVFFFVLWVRYWAGIEVGVRSGWSAGNQAPTSSYKVLSRKLSRGPKIKKTTDLQ